MADNDFSNKALENVIRNTASSIQKDYIDQQLARGVSKENLKKLDDDIAYEKALKELANNTKSFNQAIKNNIRELKNQDLIYKKLSESAKKVSSDIENIPKAKSFWNQIKNGGSDGIDWNLDRRINGLNNLLSGNFKYGALQIAQSFKIGRNLINHPMVMFVTAAAKLGFALADFSARTDRFANRIAGGSLVSPDAKNRKWEMNFQDTTVTMAYGQDKKAFYDYKVGTFGALTKQRLSRDPRFTEAWSQGRAAFEDLGANPDLMNGLLQQQIAIGRTSMSMEKFNYKLIKSLQGLDKLGSTQFLQNLTDLNKTLLANNVNGLANAESLRRFQDQLNKGTLTVSDFTRGLTSRRQGSTSTLAGVGAMLAERGLGGKELLDAYSRGDMIAVAGAVRRGGNRMQRDIEKIAPEIAQQLGTSDFREALALQSDTAWGSLSANLKNLEVQNIIAKGGSLTIALDGKDTSLDKLIEDKNGKEITEFEDFKKIDKELIKVTADNTSSLKTLTNLLTLGGLGAMSSIEKQGGVGNIINPLNNPLTPFGQLKLVTEFTIKSATH